MSTDKNPGPSHNTDKEIHPERKLDGAELREKYGSLFNELLNFLEQCSIRIGRTYSYDTGRVMLGNREIGTFVVADLGIGHNESGELTIVARGFLDNEMKDLPMEEFESLTEMADAPEFDQERMETIYGVRKNLGLSVNR